MTTSTLFSITDNEHNNKLVWKNSDSNHSKAQKDFNSALAKHKATIAEAMLLDELVQIANTEYIKLVIPEIKNSKKLIALRTEMMRDIYLEELVNLGKNKKQLLKQYILEVCSTEMENDRDFYYAIILQLETTSERNFRLSEKKRIESHIKKQYGFEVDLEELNKKNFKSAEEQEAFNAKYKDFFEKFNENENREFHDYYNGRKRKEKTKSKSEIDKEVKLAEAEKLLNTDINKLFKELAKLIHPDREQNTELRLKKESLIDLFHNW